MSGAHDSKGQVGSASSLRFNDRHIVAAVGEVVSTAFVEADIHSGSIALLEIHEEGVSQTCSIYLDAESAGQLRDWLSACLNASSSKAGPS